MLDLTLKLIDRLIALFRERDMNARKIFQDHIEPIYRQMGEVHQDYQSTLRQAEEQVSRSTMQKTQKFLEGKRRALEHLRKEIHALGEEFPKGARERFPEEARVFYRCCIAYFHAQAAERFSGYRGYYTLLVDSDFADKTQFASKLKEVISHSDKAWDELSSAYAKARLQLLK
jgi:hypothetical protein